jgi:hypothetical protein
VELFEEIRREYRFGVGTIQGVTKKLNTHRRMVRQAEQNHGLRVGQMKVSKVGQIRLSKAASEHY